MRVTYISLDEVNRFLVRRWGRAVGLKVDCPTGRRVADGSAADAVILDLDSLPADLRSGWLRRVLTGEAGGPVLAHGHNLTEPEAAALTRSGVRVCRGRVRKATVCGWLDGATVGSRRA